MKKTTLIAALLTMGIGTAMADDIGLYDLQPGHRYYIYNTYYQRPLGQKADASQPRLTEYSAENDTQFLYEAIQAPTAGYFMLRHVATGKYVCASTANSYSVVLNASSGTGDSYQWQVRSGAASILVNKRSQSNCLGVDAGETVAEIGVWYDKTTSADSTTCFHVFESNGNGLDSSRQAWARRLLADAAEYISQEVQNNKYPLVQRTKLTKSVEQANAWIASDAITADQLVEKTIHMRDSLGMMTIMESTVLLTEGEMSGFGNAFSLAMNKLELNPTYVGDNIYVLIRHKNGRGTRYAVHENGDYIFTYHDATIDVYKDQQLVETRPAYYVPQTTAQGTEAEWTIIRKSRYQGSLPEILSQNSVVTEGGGTTTNKYGNEERTVISLAKSNLTLDAQIDFHIMSEENPLTQCVINLTHPKAWLIFDNVRPSKVISDYLSQIRINGQAAQEGTNCRVAIYLNGALVMPFSAADKVLEGYDGEQYTGDVMSYAVGQHKDLGSNSNRIRSFRLKRGYMATVASDQNGKGYSRVYVADHQDIEVPVLPNALYARISSITIKKWQYVSKKGWCSTNNTDAIKDQTSKMRATWYYTWSADRQNTYDTEYIPIRQHKWWPSISQIAGHTESTACLSLNEPEHGEQHTDCDCGGVINEWRACTLTPDFQTTGMRIGSPAPTDAGWLTNYIGHCDDMAYRCDFVALHAYWGSNEAADANAWYSKLKAIYDATKRPIWITEWAYGASWTNESWPSGWNDKLEQNRARVKGILQKLEEAPFVERYAYYQWDTQYRNLVDWGDGHITPAGKVYRDLKSNFAYNASVQFIPIWWEPASRKPSLTAEISESDAQLALTVVNPNRDVTDQLVIERYNSQSEAWEQYYSESDRSLYDSDTLRYRFPLTDFDVDGDQLRVYVKRHINKGDEIWSTPTQIFGKNRKDYTGNITNPACNNDDTKGWTITNVETSKGESYDGDGSNNYFNIWKSGAYTSTMTQTVGNLPKGHYTLSAMLRAGTNANVTLQAEVLSVYPENEMTQSATFTPTGNVSAETDAYLYGWKQVTCPDVVIGTGDQIRITLTAQLPATGWWSADDFRLIWHNDTPQTAIDGIEADAHQVYYDLQGRRVEPTANGIKVTDGRKLVR